MQNRSDVPPTCRRQYNERNVLLVNRSYHSTCNSVHLQRNVCHTAIAPNALSDVSGSGSRHLVPARNTGLSMHARGGDGPRDQASVFSPPEKCIICLIVQ